MHAHLDLGQLFEKALPAACRALKLIPWQAFILWTKLLRSSATMLGMPFPASARADPGVGRPAPSARSYYFYLVKTRKMYGNWMLLNYYYYSLTLISEVSATTRTISPDEKNDHSVWLQEMWNSWTSVFPNLILFLHSKNEIRQKHRGKM